jgi:hypothetical protein
MVAGEVTPLAEMKQQKARPRIVELNHTNAKDEIAEMLNDID